VIDTRQSNLALGEQKIMRKISVAISLLTLSVVLPQTALASVITIEDIPNGAPIVTAPSFLNVVTGFEYAAILVPSGETIAPRAVLFADADSGLSDILLVVNDTNGAGPVFVFASSGAAEFNFLAALVSTFSPSNVQITAETGDFQDVSLLLALPADTISVRALETPEPASLMLLGSGMLGMAKLIRRRAK
jgi:hypothetical protein